MWKTSTEFLAKLDRHERKAIKYYEIDGKIYQKCHLNKVSAQIAVKHHILAGIQYRARLYAEALQNDQKCLDTELKGHAADNPTVAATYSNLATALDKLGSSRKTKPPVEKAIERLLRTK